MRRTTFILAIFALGSFYSCTGGQRVIDAGDAGQTTDASGMDAADTGPTCGSGQHYPEFDHQCTGNQGCTNLYAATPACGCTCAVCMDTACVRTLCGVTCQDASIEGMDADTDKDGGGVDDTGPNDTSSVLGPEYRFIDYAEMFKVNGDKVVWTIEPTPGYQRGQDICWLKISTWERKCLGVANAKTGIGGMDTAGKWISWAGIRFETRGPFNVLGLYDYGSSQTSILEDGELLMVGDPSYAKEWLVYMKSATVNGSRFQKLFKYNLLTGIKIELNNQYQPTYQYSAGDDIVYFTGDSGSKVIHYDLTTDIERQLPISATMKQYCYNCMSGRRFLWVDNTAKGTTAMMFDLDTDNVTEIYPSPYDQWFPSIFDNLVTWVDYSVSHGSLGSPGHIMVLDLDTGVRRQITTMAADYSQIIDGKHLLLTDAASVPYSAIYLYDLEANGVIKDGHVVADGTGGLTRRDQ